MPDNCANGVRRIGTTIVVVLVVVLCPVPSQADVHFTVGTPEQGGQYATVQAAVDAVPANNTERHVIDVMPGTYMARVQIPSNKPFITLRGTDPLTTKLTYNEPFDASPNESTNHASTVVLGKDFIAENLTFENTYGVGKQALAVYAKADRSIFNNCRFLGNQDTLRSENGRHYFYNSYVEGTVDFIYGKGTAYFENSTLFGKSGGYFTAQGREAASETTGYVFTNATITGSAAANTFFLGRPWGPYSRTVFIDSKMGSLVKAAGWSTWSGDNHVNSYYAEYNSMDLNGNPLNVSQRVSWSKQLTALEAEAFSKANWLGGSDGWNPVIAVVPPVLQGDYNDDGTVNAADYTVWRDSLGSEVQLLNETASFGSVDEEDYNSWKLNFGATAESGEGSLNVAPEPAGMVMFLTGLLGSACRRRVYR
jgi:pectinesterase